MSGTNLTAGLSQIRVDELASLQLDGLSDDDLLKAIFRMTSSCNNDNYEQFKPYLVKAMRKHAEHYQPKVVTTSAVFYFAEPIKDVSCSGHSKSLLLEMLYSTLPQLSGYPLANWLDYNLRSAIAVLDVHSTSFIVSRLRITCYDSWMYNLYELSQHTCDILCKADWRDYSNNLRHVLQSLLSCQPLDYELDLLGADAVDILMEYVL